MLQAPKDNDESVRELAEQVETLLAILDGAAEQMGASAATDVHGDLTAYLIQLQNLYE